MFLISHRGNINGANKNKENSPDYVYSALDKGFSVEIDVWLIEGEWFLGHDYHKYRIDFNFIKNDNFWLHAKNGCAFSELVRLNMKHVFYHTIEHWALTSSKFLWTFPTSKLYNNSICVKPESREYDKKQKIAGICSDFISHYENN